MKKLFFMTALVVVGMSSCTQDTESPSLDSRSDSQAISFGLYTNTAVTRGTAYNNGALNKVDNIGVFAFYQPATGGVKQDFSTNKFATPDFMYNQKVKTTVETAAENYTSDEAATYNGTLTGAISTSTALTAQQATVLNGIAGVGKTYAANDNPDEADAKKYNAQLTGAVSTSDVKTPATYTGEWTYTPVKYWPNNTNDQLSFFAYAPWVDGTQWEDLGIKTNINGDKLTATFPVYDEVSAMKDVLWADPVLNKGKQGTDASDKTGAGTAEDPYNYTNKINFHFAHIFSKVALEIGVKQDTKTEYGTGSTTLDAPDAWVNGAGDNTVITVKSIEFKGLYSSYAYTSTNTPKWAGSGSQNILLGEDVLKNNTSASWTIAQWYNLLNETSAVGKATEQFMFLAPQEFTDETVTINYTVKTTDAANAANSSEITNTIETKMSAILASAGSKFETGKAYTIKFLLGMTSVKFYVTVDDWDAATNYQVDVPANN